LLFIQFVIVRVIRYPVMQKFYLKKKIEKIENVRKQKGMDRKEPYKCFVCETKDETEITNEELLELERRGGLGSLDSDYAAQFQRGFGYLPCQKNSDENGRPCAWDRAGS
jgi:hypothetical protein